MKESALISKIKSTESGTERDRLISELEGTPVRHYPFHLRWIFINYSDAFLEWASSGFERASNEIPANIQLLIAAEYGKLDIENGGFHQFFSNEIGAWHLRLLTGLIGSLFQKSRNW